MQSSFNSYLSSNYLKELAIIKGNVVIAGKMFRFPTSLSYNDAFLFINQMFLERL